MNTLESNVRQQLRVRESVWMCVYNYVKTTFFLCCFFFFFFWLDGTLGYEGTKQAGVLMPDYPRMKTV